MPVRRVPAALMSRWSRVRRPAGRSPDDTPILAPAGQGTATAIEFAAAAERAGADGILLFPPCLTEAGQEGLARHVEAVCRAISLGVVVHSRANAVYAADTVARLADTCANLIGYKDGVGDIDTMTRIHTRLGERLTCIGVLPTAETFALPYVELGVTTYSSAIFSFLPDSPWTSTPRSAHAATTPSPGC